MSYFYHVYNKNSLNQPWLMVIYHKKLFAQNSQWWRDASAGLILGLYFYAVLQHIPKTILGWKYIVLFIGLFSYNIKHRIIYLQGKGCPQSFI